MRDHKKLKAFELPDEVAVLVYRITADFPKEEMYGLTSQIRQAAVSVPSNIVEGCLGNSSRLSPISLYSLWVIERTSLPDRSVEAFKFYTKPGFFPG